MNAKSIKGKSTEEIQLALQQSMADGFKPTLAFIFISIQQNIHAVVEVFDKDGITVFGATTAGEFVEDEVMDGSIAVMLVDIDPAAFKLCFSQPEDNNFYELSKQIGELGKQLFSNPKFLIGVGSWGWQGETILRGIEEAVNKNVTIFGGVAGDDLTGNGSLVFTNKKSSANGLVTLIMDGDRINIQGIAAGGWKPIGTTRRITKSEGNIIYTIENEPALQMYQKYLDETIENIRSRNNTWLLKNFAYFPILLEPKDEEPLVRTGTWTDTDKKSVHFAGPVPEGTLFRFCQPPDFDVIDSVIDEANRVLKEGEIPEADALILFSCVSRRVIFGPLVNQEIKGLKDLWNAPLAGFFCYGEIGRVDNGKNELHNTTCCLVALKEK